MNSLDISEDMDMPESAVRETILGKDVYLCGDNSTSSAALSADSDIDVEVQSNDSANGSMHSSGYANGVSSVGSNGDSNGDSNGYSHDAMTHLSCFKHSKRNVQSSGIGTSNESFSDNNSVLRVHHHLKSQICDGSESTSTSTDSDSFKRIFPDKEHVNHLTKEMTGIELEATTSFQQFHKVVEGAGKRNHIRRKPARPHTSRQAVHEDMSSSSSSSPVTEPLTEKPQPTQPCTTKSLAALYGNLHSKRSIEDGHSAKPALYSSDVKSSGGMQPDQKRRRFHRTFDALKQCGLLDLTMQTASLIEQNQSLQQQLQALKTETQNLCMTLMSNQIVFPPVMANTQHSQGQGVTTMFNFFNFSQHACANRPTLSQVQPLVLQNLMPGTSSQFMSDNQPSCSKSQIQGDQQQEGSANYDGQEKKLTKIQEGEEAGETQNNKTDQQTEQNDHGISGGNKQQETTDSSTR